jgi:predicted ABC-type transport system involved in lysophospholipase L1 biosynthesis ATPase subunit
MYAPTVRDNVMMNVMNLRPSLEVDRHDLLRVVRPRSLDSRPLISLRGVSRLYDGGAITALQNVDLQIDAGDCMAIVGASGSGKSSLVNMLCGIDHPSSGTVLWEGRPQRTRHDWTKLRRLSIGIVFQEFNLIPTLTALENVELALFGRGLSGSRRQARAATVLEYVGLQHRLNNLITRLSGGERQRVAIARAIVNAPALLIGDEPTGNLDSTSAANVAALMFRLCEDYGMTLVLVTHDEKLAARCPRRVRIKDGVIVEDIRTDLPDGLIEGPLLELQGTA